MSLKTTLRKIYRRLRYPVRHLLPTVEINAEWYGNTYGGFYLNGSQLTTDSVVYSFGIGQDITFDKAVIDRHGCKVYGFDPTPKSIEWVARQTLPARFTFLPYGVAVKSGPVKFHLPKVKDHVSGSLLKQKNVSASDAVTVAMKSVGDAMRDLGHERVDVIKMDIEGAEYSVLPALLETDIRPDHLLVEFHDRFFPDEPARSLQSVDMLMEAGYEVYAVSDTYEEVSFIYRSK